MALIWSGPARPEDERLEDAVKAAYLCKLPAFVTWPASDPADDGFVLCVVGNAPFGGLLNKVAQGQTVQRRPIIVRRYQTVMRNPGCKLMFVAGSAAEPVAAVLAAVRGSPVLTVTDGQSESDSTGIINFVLIDGHVRFQIDQQAAAENGLVISSKLLALATRVRERSTP